MGAIGDFIAELRRQEGLLEYAAVRDNTAEYVIDGHCKPSQKGQRKNCNRRDRRRVKEFRDAEQIGPGSSIDDLPDETDYSGPHFWTRVERVVERFLPPRGATLNWHDNNAGRQNVGIILPAAIAEARAIGASELPELLLEMQNAHYDLVRYYWDTRENQFAEAFKYWGKIETIWNVTLEKLVQLSPVDAPGTSAKPTEHPGHFSKVIDLPIFLEWLREELLVCQTANIGWQSAVDGAYRRLADIKAVGFPGRPSGTGDGRFYERALVDLINWAQSQLSRTNAAAVEAPSIAEQFETLRDAIHDAVFWLCQAIRPTAGGSTWNEWCEGIKADTLPVQKLNLPAIDAIVRRTTGTLPHAWTTETLEQIGSAVRLVGHCRTAEQAQAVADKVADLVDSLNQREAFLLHLSKAIGEAGMAESEKPPAPATGPSQEWKEIHRPMPLPPNPADPDELSLHNRHYIREICNEAVELAMASEVVLHPGSNPNAVFFSCSPIIAKVQHMLEQVPLIAGIPDDVRREVTKLARIIKAARTDFHSMPDVTHYYAESGLRQIAAQCQRLLARSDPKNASILSWADVGAPAESHASTTAIPSTSPVMTSCNSVSALLEFRELAFQRQNELDAAVREDRRNPPQFGEFTTQVRENEDGNQHVSESTFRVSRTTVLAESWKSQPSLQGLATEAKASLPIGSQAFEAIDRVLAAFESLLNDSLESARQCRLPNGSVSEEFAKAILHLDTLIPHVARTSSMSSSTIDSALSSLADLKVALEDAATSVERGNVTFLVNWRIDHTKGLNSNTINALAIKHGLRPNGGPLIEADGTTATMHRAEGGPYSWSMDPTVFRTDHAADNDKVAKALRRWESKVDEMLKVHHQSDADRIEIQSSPSDNRRTPAAPGDTLEQFVADLTALHGALLSTEPRSRKPPQSAAIEEVAKKIPQILADHEEQFGAVAESAHEAGTLFGPLGMEIQALAERLVALGHGLATAKWAIHTLTEAGLLRPAFIVGRDSQGILEAYVPSDREPSGFNIVATDELWKWEAAGCKLINESEPGAPEAEPSEPTPAKTPSSVLSVVSEIMASKTFISAVEAAGVFDELDKPKHYLAEAGKAIRGIMGTSGSAPAPSDRRQGPPTLEKLGTGGTALLEPVRMDEPRSQAPAANVNTAEPEFPPDDGWHFEPGAFFFRKVRYDLVGLPLEVLRQFASSRLGRKLGYSDLRPALDNSNAMSEDSIKVHVGGAREALRKVCVKLQLDIPDPLPNTKTVGWEFKMPRK